MSDMSSTKNEPIQPPPATLRWQSWPAREKPLRTGVLAVGMAGAVVGIYLSSGQPLIPVLALAAFVASLWRFFLPVVFELNEGGVDQQIFGRPRRIPWQAVRGYTIHSEGVLLLPYKDPSPLSAFRGLFVPFSTHRNEILTHVSRYLDRAERS